MTKWGGWLRKNEICSSWKMRFSDGYFFAESSLFGESSSGIGKKSCYHCLMTFLARRGGKIEKVSRNWVSYT